MKRFFAAQAGLILLSICALPAALAAPSAPGGSGMTLWQVIHSGGAVMIVLGCVSLVLLSLVTFLFLRMSDKRVAPLELLEKITPSLQGGDYARVRRDITGSEAMLAGIVLAGLEHAPRGPKAASEAVEKAARSEVAGLWTMLGYVSDIAQISPMLGLLGTVLGMIQAFNNIAFDTGVVKPILLAGGVAKAMITTAGGLVLAITATAFYSALKTRIQYTIHSLESAVNRVMEAFARD